MLPSYRSRFTWSDAAVCLLPGSRWLTDNVFKFGAVFDLPSISSLFPIIDQYEVRVVWDGAESTALNTWPEAAIGVNPTWTGDLSLLAFVSS